MVSGCGLFVHLRHLRLWVVVLLVMLHDALTAVMCVFTAAA